MAFHKARRWLKIKAQPKIKAITVPQMTAKKRKS